MVESTMKKGGCIALSSGGMEKNSVAVCVWRGVSSDRPSASTLYSTNVPGQGISGL